MSKTHFLAKPKSLAVFLFTGILLLFGFAFVYVSFGAKEISFKLVIKALFAYDAQITECIYIRDSRLARYFAGIIVGASLALTGSIMQGSTNNPLADAGLLGISSGASFAIVLIAMFLPAIGRLQMFALTSLGSFLSTVLVIGISFMGKSTFQKERLVLAGMSVSMLFSSLTMIFIIKGKLFQKMAYYNAGSLANANWSILALAIPVFIVFSLFSIAISKQLTILNLGNDVAISLGVKVSQIGFIVLIIVLVLTSISVILIGPVAYIGLIVPHLVRRMVGTDYRYILPTAMLMGSVLVVVCDFFARIILRPSEIPIGVIISLIGVPVLIWVSRQKASSMM
ncbi:MAG: ferrichrome ABC transporter permease [Treponema sp.]|nr:MAG: ferrichrome ABC transporter permease [Treponema sp.]